MVQKILRFVKVISTNLNIGKLLFALTTNFQGLFVNKRDSSRFFEIKKRFLTNLLRKNQEEGLLHRCIK